ncbi:hypothetical protein [Flavobacterium sp. KACC 22763]|uniref:hypothetical protein n=1 Tax=Flavobacterium sp. KACC 22763 TaxID=3025668 RepID=UPI0023650E26|nr:hypothetical protein [Flavobacterium sp. KACC 22763]WDF64010.1 hypothetical protein PQ463_20595 [Flavobacterium sp. KACC 22763]
MKTYITIIFLMLLAPLSAQNDTIFFDKNWKISSKEAAIYYRIKPLKVKTKDAVGYKIKNIDSLFTIKDYYLNSNKIQFQGYSKDYNGDYLVGKAKWHNENDDTIETREFNYREYNTSSKFRIPDWPILYLNYSIANKSLLTAGMEFCLDCYSDNKLFIGAGYGITNSYSDKYYGLPDLHLAYNSKTGWFCKAGASNKHAYTLVGLSWLNAIDFGLGYSQPFSYEKAPVIKGLLFGLNIRLTKNKDAILPMKFM